MMRLWLVLLVIATPLLAQEKKPAVDAAGDPLPPGAVLRLGTIRWRHGAAVTALSFTPDGKRLLSAGRDGTVRLWDVTDGKEIATVESVKDPVVSIAVSPDGKLLAAVNEKGRLRLLRLPGGDLVYSSAGLLRPITGVAFSPDGKQIAAGSSTRHVYLINPTSGLVIRHFDVDTAVAQVAFTADGKRLCISGDGDTGVGLWSIQEERALHVQPGWTGSFCVGNKDAILVADHDTPLAVYDMARGLRLHFLRDRKRDPLVLLRPVVAAGGELMASGCGEGHVRVFRADNGNEVWQTLAHPSGVKGLALSRDGKLLASADADGVIHLRDAATGKPIGEQRGPAGAVLGVAISPDGKSAAVVSREGGIRTWAMKDGAETAKELLDLDHCLCVLFSPDGKSLIGGTAAGNLIRGEPGSLRSGKTLATLRGAVNSLVGLADGTLYVAGQDRVVRRWDVGAKEGVILIGGQGQEKVRSLAVSADGRTILAADGTFWPKLYDRHGRPGVELGGHNGGCYAVALLPSGRVAITGGRDDSIRMHEVASGKERRSLPGWAWCEALAVAPDGVVFASGHADGRVRLWDATSGLRLRTFEGHRAGVTSLAFSSDGKRLISGGLDTTAVVWEITPAVIRRPEPLDLSAEKLTKLWEDLADGDTSVALEAIQTMARGGDGSVALVRKHVQPVTEEEMKGLMADLDANKFPVRTRAIKRLTALGRFIEPFLRAELGRQPPLEVRRRIEDILRAVNSTERPTEQVRTMRALEVLEMIASPAARDVLKEIASGSSACELTHEAKSTLDRLTKRGRKE